MRVTLEVKSGMSIGRRFDVLEGTQAVFGRSREATHPVEHDPLLAERHFSVVGDEEGWHLTALSEDAATVLNGESVKTALLKKGDRISAGRTVFLVTDIELTQLDSSLNHRLPVVGAEGAPQEEGPPPQEETAEVAAAEEEPTGPELLEWFGFDEDVQAVAKPGQTAEELLAVFTGKGESSIAIRLRAHVLGARAAVWWGCLCLKEVFGGEPPAKERIAWHAAKSWVADPGEENRRNAEKAGPAAGMKGLCSFLCAAAFWSGGSLAPAGMTAVPPDVRLTGQGIAGLLHMAAPHGDPAKADERFETFLRLGDEVAEGAHPFPEA